MVSWSDCEKSFNIHKKCNAMLAFGKSYHWDRQVSFRSLMSDPSGFLCTQDVTIVSACAPPGGGRNPVTPRFIRHFSMLCLPMPSEHSLKQIFQVSVDFNLGKRGKRKHMCSKPPTIKVVSCVSKESIYPSLS